MTAAAGGDRIVVAEFPDAGALETAIAALDTAAWVVVDTYTPRTLETEPPESALFPHSAIPIVALLGALAGAAIAFLIEWWTNARSYPLDVGARPRPAIPAYVPIVFESLILSGACCTVLAWLVTTGLPRLWAPVDDTPGFPSATLGRYWSSFSPPPALSRTAVESVLRAEGALAIAWIGGAP